MEEVDSVLSVYKFIVSNKDGIIITTFILNKTLLLICLNNVDVRCKGSCYNIKLIFET